METLKYKIISSEKQYDSYCKKLEELVFSPSRNKGKEDEIDLLTLLIEKWDEEHNIFQKLDPIQLLKSLMSDHSIKPVALAKLLNISEGLVSDILHYKKGLSKETVRLLSSHFKLKQEAFNRPYKIHSRHATSLRKSKKIGAGVLTD